MTLHFSMLLAWFLCVGFLTTVLGVIYGAWSLGEAVVRTVRWLWRRRRIARHGRRDRRADLELLDEILGARPTGQSQRICVPHIRLPRSTPVEAADLDELTQELPAVREDGAR